MREIRCSLAAIAVIVGFANFLWFAVESSALGGDALNGYANDGRYYVGTQGHYREVKQAQWEWSRLHAVSMFVTTAIAVAGIGYITARCFSQGLMRIRRSADVDRRVRLVQASGDEIASELCRARVGLVVYWGQRMRVSVFPGGILLRELFGLTAAILRPEVEGIRVNREFFGARGIQIDHSARDIDSPVVLGIATESPVVRAIEGVTGMSLQA